MKKRGKRILGGVLAAVMAASMGASAFAASAAETQPDTSLPQGVTQDLVDQAVTNMDKNIVSILGLVGLDWSSVVSNKTVGELIGTLHDLFAPLAESSGMALGPQMFELYAAFENLPTNPLDDYWWYDIEDVPFTELDYGVANGDVDAFITAVKDVLSWSIWMMLGQFAVDYENNPMYAGTGMVTPEEPDFVTGPLTMLLSGIAPDAGIALPEPFYRYGLYPIYQGLGLDAITVDEYTEMYLSTAPVSPGDSNFNKAVELKNSGASEEEINAQLDQYFETTIPSVAAYAKYLDMMAGPLFDLVAQVLKNPLSTIVNFLPKLDSLIQSGECSWLFDLLGNFLPDVFPADAAPANLVELVNSVLANVQVNGATLGLTLPAFDFAALDELSMADRSVATVNYLTETITTEENLAAITALVPAAGAILGGLSADDLGYVVINFLATGSLAFPGEDPGTGDNDPGTGDNEPGTGGNEPGTTTDGGDEPTTTDPVDTGDAALSAVVLAAAAAAAGVLVLSRRKK